MVVLLALACTGSPPAPVAPGPTEPTPVPAAAPTAAKDPLAGLSTTEICESDALLLIKYDYAEVASGFHTLCCADGMVRIEGRCELDWPFSDVPSCKAWDYMRNSIFARHGFVFKDAQWRESFGAQPWYVPDPGFDPATMGEVAKRNVQLLKKHKAEGYQCADMP